MNEDEPQFWARKIAKTISSRTKFHFTESEIPRLQKWAVKSSSSLSGVLHIGRLSDIIRSEAVARALEESGFPAEFIYVTEDMDPLRKLPAGLPVEYEKYIGFAVSDIPDADGCHKSYAEHHLMKFFEVVGEFLYLEPKIYSMREEYKKGNFNGFIEKILSNSEAVMEIINRHKDNPSAEKQSLWKPICDNCGNLQTTVAIGFDGKRVKYKCVDYAFEKFTAKGCGYEGESDLSKANGKMAWKGEWASQWCRWNVCSEGAGKEYIQGNSAWYVNAEIAERVLKFPMPEPIFYEHLNIGGQKMSASVGNVVYPVDWLEVSRPEALKYLYVKRIMKTRAFLWEEIPNLELELDRVVEAKFGLSKETDEKKLNQALEQFDFAGVRRRRLSPIPVDYSFAAALVQLFPGNNEIISRLSEMGHLKGNESNECLELLGERLNLARNWVAKRAPENVKTGFLEIVSAETLAKAEKFRGALASAAKLLESASGADEAQTAFGSAAKESGNAREFFQLCYQLLIGKNEGPRIGSLALALGKEKVICRLLGSA
ncbi:MAG: lysine--tRNA ligase [archaeon]